ncbi:hypothetical protein BDP55DRAFT_733369 [Colletotrichum godetiae]|uniref:Uncharacterized protein n=1 Tax=Colletotrichum godetiae TaxID=1209918 RepID=A0AAJ0AB48_9PEZI|nr:uncharacterized protein BDP55DRAFT_733369 [Colletotrichum godetiae]KAK1659279.1 hypothetical protein BDP55DRAFT_733369 [Colletotrichum godetiae]
MGSDDQMRGGWVPGLALWRRAMRPEWSDLPPYVTPPALDGIIDVVPAPEWSPPTS